MIATSDTKTQLELRLLLAAAARVGIAPTVSNTGSGAIEMIAGASERGAKLVRDRRARNVSCKGCSATWSGLLVPDAPGALDIGCPLCEGELQDVAKGHPSNVTGETKIVTGDPVTVAAGQTPASEVEAAFAAADAASEIPARIGAYRVVKVIGRGGMGAVLEAVDERTQARVAIKLIAGWGATDLDARLRFEREGKVLTLLAHPHIVRFVERGEHGQQLYIAMELVEGKSLSELLEWNPLPVAEAARIARAVAEGLGYAHALGLTHRDVKPGNVLLGDDGSIKLADFGLARRREESLALTAPGTVVGTPIYMAPEQLEGTQAGPPADLYALGVMLYHMLAGAPPFEGSFAQIAAQRQRGQIAPLRDKCPGCPEPLQALVEKLLRRDPAQRPTATETARLLGSFEPPSTIVRPQAKAAPVARDARNLAAGDTVGPFTIEAKLGAGGMGSVFKARKADGSLVALKLIAKPLDANASQRFAREARALSEVSHPNVVRFLDAGESDGLSWIATDLVPGRSLDEVVLAEGALPEAKLLDVAEAVAGALAALHEEKIIHRDVKPQNIMVRPDGGVVLVDLGLAKFLATQTALTETGALLGTPHYMAPEQLLGRPVDGRTDLYALGAALYHAATGKRPFDGETTTAVAFQQVNVSPPPVRAVNRKLSAPFGALVARLLEKRATSRPASAVATLALVARVRKGEALDEARSRIARAAGLVLAVLAVACVVAIWFAAKVKDQGVQFAGANLAREAAPAPTLAAAPPVAPAERALSDDLRAVEKKEAEQTKASAIGGEPSDESFALKEKKNAPRQEPNGKSGAKGASGGSGPSSPAPARHSEEAKDAKALESTPGAPSANAAAASKPGEADGGAAVRAKNDAASEQTRAKDGARMVLAGEVYVDAAPVTVKQWKLFRAAAGDQAHFSCDAANEPAGFTHATAVEGADEAPVHGIAAWDADAYARWAGGRLPTRDELGAGVAEWTLEAKSADKPAGAEKLAFRCVVPAR